MSKGKSAGRAGENVRSSGKNRAGRGSGERKKPPVAGGPESISTLKMRIAPVAARAAARDRTQGKITLFPQGEGSVGSEIVSGFPANPLRKPQTGSYASIVGIVSPSGLELQPGPNAECRDTCADEREKQPDVHFFASHAVKT